jgi:NADPH:quinone reductase-like Zn-dependent oxidoreductase
MCRRHFQVPSYVALGTEEGWRDPTNERYVMRALTVSPPGLATISEIDSPQLEEGHVLVDVRFAAIDSGDRHVADGVYHDLGFITMPTVGLGWDFSGTVLEAAADTGFQTGQRVVGVIDTFEKAVGAISERVCVPANALTRLPESLKDEQAAVLPVAALTAAQALSLLGDDRGSLLVTGAAGAVGGSALAIANELGFTVTGFARAADREFVESTGATFIDSIVDHYDAVVDAAVLGEVALAAVRDGGRYISLLPGGEPEAARGVHIASLTVLADQTRLRAMVDLAARGVLPMRIAGIIGLDEAPRAVAEGTPPGVRGRVVVRF